MPECGLCEKLVLKLKTNSHIFPRWTLKELKENGKLVKISEDEVRPGHQSDPKGDFVCDGCELLFGDDDAWATTFF